MSTWIPAEGSPGTPIEAYLAIRQTFSFIKIRLMTRESNSHLLAGSIVRDPSGLYVVTGIYRNLPDLFRRLASPIHHGAMLSNGQRVTRQLAKQFEEEELEKIRASQGAAAAPSSRLDEARGLFDEVALSDQFVEFLTLPAYGHLD